MRPWMDRRGVALMLVLWLIVVLATIAVGVAALVRGEANVTVNVRARAAARYAAESGIVAATWRLRTLLHAARTPRDQALVFRRLDRVLGDVGEEQLGATQFQVAVADLDARIDLNNADAPMLIAFLEQFVDERQASELADALMDWRDTDELVRAGGAEREQYARAGSPFVPSNRPLQRLDELTRIKGFSDSLAERLAPYVTIRGAGRVDINTAPPQVLRALPGVGREGARLLVEARDHGDVFTSPAAVWSVMRNLGAPVGSIDISKVAILPQRILIVSRGWDRGHALTHEVQAVFEVDGERLTLRFWTERDL